MKHNTLLQSFGNIDIYLFDQLLKGRFDACESILDVGCGSGRNLVYFFRNGYKVFGIDQDMNSIETVRELAAQLTPQLPADNFCLGLAEAIPFEDNQFDLVISSAVFHFARDRQHFEEMLHEAWRVIKPGGYLFARLASDIGIEKSVLALGSGRFRLADGSDRYLVNEAMLLAYTDQLGGKLCEPIKTTNVQQMRCMSTWCLQKM